MSEISAAHTRLRWARSLARHRSGTALGSTRTVASAAIAFAAATFAIAWAVPSRTTVFLQPVRTTRKLVGLRNRLSQGVTSRRAVPTAGGGQKLLEATDVFASYDDLRILFRIQRLALQRGQKLGIVGSNGCGKSTLLTSLAGQSKLKGGEVSFQPNLQVAMVEQKPDYDRSKTVLDTIYSKATSPQAAAVMKYRQALAMGSSVDSGDLQKALDEMSARNAWDWESKTAQVVAELGLGQLLDRTMEELSGGEERRVALSCALVDLDTTDLLVLDEPTNHLSVEGCEWLQGTLQSLQSTGVVLVTHDRYFLDAVCDQILEIDGMGETFSHPGGWDVFLTRRAERYEQRAGAVNDAKVQLKRAQEWMNRGPQGRGTKNRNQIKGYFEVKDKAQAIIAADDGTPDFGARSAQSSKIGTGQRTSGSSVNLGLIALRNATVRRSNGDAILDAVSFAFRRGMKVGVIGPNGAGKSTLLRAISGDQSLDAGERIEGDAVRLGFLNQEAYVWKDPQQTVRDHVAEMADKAMLAEETLFPDMKHRTREQNAANLLKQVNFAQERWHTQVGRLSGGEARRLQLLSVLSQRPNVLLLDEPTNDLDAVTVDSLEGLLRPWKGTVIIVSHDRSLLDGVCDTFVVFPNGGGPPRYWHGTYSDWKEHDRLTRRVQSSSAKVEGVPSDGAKTGMSKREKQKTQRALKQVEQKIESTEESLAEVKVMMEDSGGDAERVMELYEQTQELEKTQEMLLEEWEALAVQLEE